MRNDFINGIAAHQSEFDIELTSDETAGLADYYELVLEHNPLLHLVGPCDPEEFATRHILESLTMLEHLPKGAKFADIGSGGGLPAIPSLIVRADLTAILIESKAKKAKFLEEAVEKLGIGDRVTIITRQFEEGDSGNAQFVSCRALDKFADKLPKLLKWSKGKTKVFFGGENLAAVLDKNKVKFRRKLMPLSERRYLFVIDK